MEGHSSSVRGIGGVLVGCAAAIFAEHIGMPEWKVIAVAVLVGVGLPILVGGRFQNC